MTTSLRFLPTRALPIGDSLESLCSTGLASVEPTIWNFCESPVFWSLTWTTEPKPTSSVPSAFSSITVARRSRSSSCAIRPSSSACSFLASSYSAFSEMSPNSRASLIRAATSRRLVVERMLDLLFQLLETLGGDDRLTTHLHYLAFGLGGAPKRMTPRPKKTPRCSRLTSRTWAQSRGIIARADGGQSNRSQRHASGSASEPISSLARSRPALRWSSSTSAGGACSRSLYQG